MRTHGAQSIGSLTNTARGVRICLLWSVKLLAVLGISLTITQVGASQEFSPPEIEDAHLSYEHDVPEEFGNQILQVDEYQITEKDIYRYVAERLKMHTNEERQDIFARWVGDAHYIMDGLPSMKPVHKSMMHQVSEWTGIKFLQFPEETRWINMIHFYSEDYIKSFDQMSKQTQLGFLTGSDVQKKLAKANAILKNYRLYLKIASQEKNFTAFTKISQPRNLDAVVLTSVMVFQNPYGFFRKYEEILLMDDHLKGIMWNDYLKGLMWSAISLSLVGDGYWSTIAGSVTREDNVRQLAKVGRHGLPMIDRVFIQAAYAPNVANGTVKEEAALLITREMVRIIKSEKNHQ